MVSILQKYDYDERLTGGLLAFDEFQFYRSTIMMLRRGYDGADGERVSILQKYDYDLDGVL